MSGRRCTGCVGGYVVAEGAVSLVVEVPAFLGGEGGTSVL